jgi:hypothetical protein
MWLSDGPARLSRGRQLVSVNLPGRNAAAGRVDRLTVRLRMAGGFDGDHARGNGYRPAACYRGTNRRGYSGHVDSPLQNGARDAGLTVASFPVVRGPAESEFVKNRPHLHFQRGACFLQGLRTTGFLAVHMLQLKLGPGSAGAPGGAVDTDAQDEGMHFIQVQASFP